MAPTAHLFSITVTLLSSYTLQFTTVMLMFKLKVKLRVESFRFRKRNTYTFVFVNTTVMANFRNKTIYGRLVQECQVLL